MGQRFSTVDNASNPPFPPFAKGGMGGFICLGLISLKVSVLLFDTGFELTAIVKIGKVENIVHPDDSYQVIVHGDALDSAGFVFDVDLNFYPKTYDRKEKILGDLTMDSIF